MRLSAAQKDTLFALFAIAQQGMTKPIPFVKLLNMINSSRLQQVFPNNYRVSCHTLAKNGLLKKYRHPQTLTLAFALTEQGREVAENIHQQRIKTSVN